LWSERSTQSALLACRACCRSTGCVCAPGLGTSRDHLDDRKQESKGDLESMPGCKSRSSAPTSQTADDTSFAYLRRATKIATGVYERLATDTAA
jgi:hypothetical protein